MIYVDVADFLITRRIKFLLLALVQSFLLAISTDVYAAEKYYIFSFNDFHGYVSETKNTPGIAKLASILDIIKKDLGATDSNSFTVFSGDNYYGQSISNNNNGKLVSSFIRKVGIKFSAIGNHEFDWHQSYFYDWVKDSGVKFLNGNIYQGDKLFMNFPQYEVVNFPGMKICIIGLTTTETLTSLPKQKISHVNIYDVSKKGREIVSKIKELEKPDLIIALTHVPGYREVVNSKISYGKELSSILDIKEINAYFTGHSHEIYADKVNHKAVIQAGKHGKNIGVLEITKDGNNITLEPRIIDALHLAKLVEPEKELDQLVKKEEVLYKKSFGYIISHNDYDFNTSRNISSINPLAAYLGKEISHHYDVDGFIMNGGAFRDDLNKGPISIGDIHSAFPFNDELVIANIKGLDLKNILKKGMIADEDKHVIQFYGFKVVEAGSNLDVFLLSNNQRVEDHMTYKIALGSHMLPSIDNIDLSMVIDPVNTQVVIRDFLIDNVKKSEKMSFPSVDYLVKH